MQLLKFDNHFGGYLFCINELFNIQMLDLILVEIYSSPQKCLDDEVPQEVGKSGLEIRNLIPTF